MDLRQKRSRDLAAAGQRRETELDGLTQRTDPAIRPGPPDPDEGRLFAEHAFEIRPRPVTRDVEHQVVALPAQGEVLTGVVDDVVGSERSGHVDVPRAADAGYFCP